MTHPIIEGSGSYGIVYSTPRLPYLSKYNFSNGIDEIDENIEIENLEDDSYLKNEVSKVFYDDYDYLMEIKKYRKLLFENKLDCDYFVIPLNYGRIDLDYIFTNINLFNYKSNNNKSYKKIYLTSKYQITFLKGIKLKNIELYDKIENIINIIKYLNNNNYIFDDIKIKNLIKIENKIKIIDFCSLLKISDLNLITFNKSFLSTFYYYIYNPLLNTLLFYYLSKKENDIINMNYLIDYLEYEEEKKEQKSHNCYLNDMIRKVFYYLDNKLNTINFSCITIYNNDKLETNIELKIKKILQSIFFYLYKNKKEKNDIYELNLKNLIKYYDSLYNNVDDIIEIISKKINMYSLGIIFLETIYKFINNQIETDVKNNINIINKLFILFAQFSLTIFNVDTNIYLVNNNIEDITKLFFNSDSF